ncbi:hypothetical protein [Flavobacterium sp. ACN6]|uniref:hypothetical protein n=1 Tax=Flavobacterium sp. ACN6 TaxID=1920426 RepID=UPI000BB37852|nr:hypothetical protein [Flavobacterium sp. ACN6]PBJ08000.1 hypothetical protein BSF42_37170 [Flavobacterium sp. ACN6]
MKLNTTKKTKVPFFPKFLNQKLRFNSIFFISGLLFNITWGISLFITHAVEFYIIGIAALLLIINGAGEIFFSLSNKAKLEGWGLFIQSGMFTILTGALIFFDLVNIINVNEVFLSYFFIAGLFNLTLAGSLAQYGMIDWTRFTNLNRAVVLLSITALFIVLSDWGDTDILLGITSIFFGCGRMILTLNFSELNTFPDKVSRDIYRKIDGVTIEYFEALEKNWDADRNLFL